jgi:hypothetical protein
LAASYRGHPECLTGKSHIRNRHTDLNIGVRVPIGFPIANLIADISCFTVHAEEHELALFSISRLDMNFLYFLRHPLIAISGAIQSGPLSQEALKEKADYIRNKLADDDFEALTNEINADYVEKFSEVSATIKLPDAEVLPGKVFAPFKINGVKVRFSPQLLLRRLDKKTNKQRRGAFMLRYAKGKVLAPSVGGFQSAAAFGLLKDYDAEQGSEVDKAICVTLDAFSGEIYAAPNAAVSMFANMKAACETIAERWPNIKPPQGRCYLRRS